VRGDLHQPVATALRFVLSASGVHTAIVGTTKPERFSENASALEAGTLPDELFESIRSRWREVASSDWVGQT
jgi:aryl-alcohol dehydrogenase-like predicted oxidoreductase